MFMHPIVNELKAVEYGITFDKRNIKFFLIAGVFDKPAKASILNMKSSNGFFGCTKCLQPGISHKNSKTQGK